MEEFTWQWKGKKKKKFVVNKQIVINFIILKKIDVVTFFPIKIWEDNFFKGLRLEERFFPKKKKKRLEEWFAATKKDTKVKLKNMCPPSQKKEKEKKKNMCPKKKKL